jgi:hypothetical protein
MTLLFGKRVRGRERERERDLKLKLEIMAVINTIHMLGHVAPCLILWNIFNVCTDSSKPGEIF